MPPNLIRKDTEQMERIRMAWLHREDLPIERLRFRKPARLVMLNRQPESLWDRHRAG
jgi:hypothetical protein